VDSGGWEKGGWNIRKGKREGGGGFLHGLKSVDTWGVVSILQRIWKAVVLQLNHWKWVNVISFPNHDFTYKSCIERLNHLSRALYLHSNAKSNTAMVLIVT